MWEERNWHRFRSLLVDLRIVCLSKRQSMQANKLVSEQENLLSIGSLCKWLQQSRLCQAEARSQELYPASHMGGRGPKYFGCIPTHIKQETRTKVEQPGLELMLRHIYSFLRFAFLCIGSFLINVLYMIRNYWHL